MFILKKILYIISGGVALLAVGIFIGAQYSGVLKNIRIKVLYRSGSPIRRLAQST